MKPIWKVTLLTIFALAIIAAFVVGQSSQTPSVQAAESTPTPTSTVGWLYDMAPGGLICASFNGIPVGCYCPCDTGLCLTSVPEGFSSTATAAVTITPTLGDPTLTPTLTATNTLPPPATLTPTPTLPPPATEIPQEKHAWITHYDGQGNFVWKKCMPISAQNGHNPEDSSHKGHPVRDDIGGACTP